MAYSQKKCLATCETSSLASALTSGPNWIEFDGEDDHVHLLVNYPPKVSVSSLVNSLKGVSSRMIRKKNYPCIGKKLWGGAYGRPLILLEVVAAHLSQLFANTSNSNKLHINPLRTTTPSSPYIPALKDGVLRQTG